MTSRFPASIRMSATAFAVIAIAGALAAQPTRGKQVPGRPAPEPGEILPVLQFGGGKVAEYVDLVKGLVGVNIVMDDDVGRAAMPPVELKEVSVLTALNLIPMLAKGPAAREILMNPVGGEGGDPTPVYVLKTSPTVYRPGMPMPMSMADQQKPRLEVFSLNDLIGPNLPLEAKKHRVDSILSAVHHGIDEIEEPDVPSASVKFHEESGLLFMKGFEDQLQVVKEVLAQLEGTRQSKASATKAAEAEALAKKVESLTAEVERLRKEIEDLRKARAEPEAKKP